jgi:parallel beta-helix repeat protein
MNRMRNVFPLIAASLALMLATPRPASAELVPVSDASGLVQAIANASAGDEIVLASGTYAISSNINCTAAGTAQAPIVVRAAVPRTVLLQFGSGGGVVEGFKVLAPHWRFEGLDIEGVCAQDSNCEHAFHLIGDADFTVIRDNHVRDFNAQIKSNIATVSSAQFPDDVLVEANTFQDTRARVTANPVTKIDVVGGRRWRVRGNTLRGFQKDGGDTVSYGAFLKGNSRDGLFERNLVICEDGFSGGVQIGLSFGGGGTSPAGVCEDNVCIPEHQNGIMRNNLILNCSDVGVYLNSAANSRIQHNTLYATAGIDFRFAATTGDARNNLVSGPIRDRSSGGFTASGNLTDIAPGTFAAWFMAPANADFRLLDGTSFVDLGAAAPLVLDDYCGNDRDDGLPDIGALEYDDDFDCLTARGGGIGPGIFTNGFEN